MELDRNDRVKCLSRLCRTFREAIDSAIERGDFIKDRLFGRFPCGCCDEACDLLQLFFAKQGIESTPVRGEWIGADLEDGCPHVWVALEGNLIADITGDQFLYGPVPVRCSDISYVGPLDSFHAQFGTPCVLPRLETYPAERLEKVIERYEIIVRYMNNDVHVKDSG